MRRTRNAAEGKIESLEMCSVLSIIQRETGGCQEKSDISWHAASDTEKGNQKEEDGQMKGSRGIRLNPLVENASETHAEHRGVLTMEKVLA